MGGAQSNDLDERRSALSEDNHPDFQQYNRRLSKKMTSGLTFRDEEKKIITKQEKSNSDLSELSQHSVESNQNQVIKSDQANFMEKIYMKSLLA